MARTLKLKILYGVLLIVIARVVLATVRTNEKLLFPLIICLIIPGRVVGYLWKDLITGRRLMDRKQFSAAFPKLETFIRKVEKSPWIDHLSWISPSFYTVSGKAMAHNNIGCCHLEQGTLRAATESFEQALEIDHLYPLPHFNLAKICELEGNSAASLRHLEEARQLGYTGGEFDQQMDRLKAVYAKLEPASKL